jgi:hypothetical protein
MNQFRDAGRSQGRLIVSWPDNVPGLEGSHAKMMVDGTTELRAADLREDDVLYVVTYAKPYDPRESDPVRAFDLALSENEQRNVANQIAVDETVTLE